MFGCVVKEDGLWGPAPALNPLLARQQAAARQQQQQLKHGQQSNKSATHTASRSSAAGSADVSASDAGGGSKKKKRMQKLDSSVLGFTVIADPQRTNAGELEKIWWDDRLCCMFVWAFQCRRTQFSSELVTLTLQWIATVFH